MVGYRQQNRRFICYKLNRWRQVWLDDKDLNIMVSGLTVRPELVEGWTVKPFMVRQAHHERLNLKLSESPKH